MISLAAFAKLASGARVYRWLGSYALPETRCRAGLSEPWWRRWQAHCQAAGGSTLLLDPDGLILAGTGVGLISLSTGTERICKDQADTMKECHWAPAFHELNSPENRNNMFGIGWCVLL